MPFLAVISDEKNKSTWSKIVNSLSLISENIKFVITEESLSLSSINVARTSHAEIILKKDFFYDYEVNFADVVSEGFERDRNDILRDDGYSNCSYSFLVNSKHMAALFKNPDMTDLEYICLQLNWGRDVYAPLQFKLLIENRTKSMIVKSYQAGIQPVSRNKLDLSLSFKEELYDAKRRRRIGNIRSISYIMVEQRLLKQFLETVPSGTEDMRIDIKIDRMLLTGFTKEIVKDKEYLRNQVLVTVTLNINELNDFHLLKDESGLYLRRTINYRLKDFRNFVTLIGSLDRQQTNDIVTDSQLDEPSFSFAREAYIEVYFKGPGDPILFEYQGNQSVIIQLVQITDANSDQDALSDRVETEKRHQSIIKPHILHKLPKKRSQLVIEENDEGKYNLLRSTLARHNSRSEPKENVVDNSRNEDNLSLFVAESQSQEMTSSLASGSEEVVRYRQESGDANLLNLLNLHSSKVFQDRSNTNQESSKIEYLTSHIRDGKDIVDKHNYSVSNLEQIPDSNLMDPSGRRPVQPNSTIQHTPAREEPSFSIKGSSHIIENESPPLEEDTDYESGEESAGLQIALPPRKKTRTRNLSKSNGHEEALGPTQGVSAPKSIFDHAYD